MRMQRQQGDEGMKELRCGGQDLTHPVLVCSSPARHTLRSDRAEAAVPPAALRGRSSPAHPGRACGGLRLHPWALEQGTYVTHNKRLLFFANSDSVFPPPRKLTSSLGHRWSGVFLPFPAHSQRGAEGALSD